MLFITARRWLMALEHRCGIVPMLGDWKWLSPPPSKQRSRSWPQAGKKQSGDPREYKGVSVPSSLTLCCLAPVQVQAGRSVHWSSHVKCKNPDRHKKSTLNNNKIRLYLSYPSPGCAGDLLCQEHGSCSGIPAAMQLRHGISRTLC